MHHILRLIMFLIALTGALAPADAQNYDGRGRLRFGVFMQGYLAQGEESKPAIASGNLNGYGVGASFGYDYTIAGPWIVGVEADGVVTDGSNLINGSTYNTDYLATFRGRIGYNIHPHLLMYATGGYALHGLHYRGATTPTVGNPNPVLKVSGTVGGLTVGGGLEWRLHDTIVFGEYLYSPFDSFEFIGGFNARHEIETDAHQFRVGVKWLYGHDHYVDDIRPRR